MALFSPGICKKTMLCSHPKYRYIVKFQLSRVSVSFEMHLQNYLKMYAIGPMLEVN